MKLSVSQVIFVTIFSSVSTLPVTSKTEEDSTSNSLQNNFQVIQGPQEFMVPLDPLKSILSRWSKNQDAGSTGDPSDSSDSDSPVMNSDLDYIVYGKIYLMKALGISQRSVDSLSNQNGHNLANLDTTEISSRFQDTEQYKDGIAFKAATKRPYRFWKNRTSSNVSGGIANAVTRKLEERSADNKNEPPASSTETLVDSQNVDKEGLELLANYVPNNNNPQQSPLFSGAPETSQNVPGNGNTHDKKNIVAAGPPEIDDRFLISVPQKPSIASSTSPCPEGQRRTHRGRCKPVFVHNPSPQDGIFAGRIMPSSATTTTTTTSTSTPKTTNRNNAATSPENNSNLKPLASLFKSLVEMERRLEKAVHQAEDKLSEIEHQQEDHASSSTPKVTSN